MSEIKKSKFFEMVEDLMEVDPEDVDETGVVITAFFRMKNGEHGCRNAFLVSEASMGDMGNIESVMPSDWKVLLGGGTFVAAASVAFAERTEGEMQDCLSSAADAITKGTRQ